MTLRENFVEIVDLNLFKREVINGN